MTDDYSRCDETEDHKHVPVPAAVHDAEMPEGYFTVECEACHQTTGYPMPDAEDITWD